MSTNPTPFGVGLQLQATTGPAGFALQNATPNIISWTAPNDGQLHRMIVFSQLTVTSAQTGGAVGFVATGPGGGAVGGGMYAGGLAASTTEATEVRLVEAGTTVTIEQTSAQTLGAATLWAEIWAE